MVSEDTRQILIGSLKNNILKKNVIYQTSIWNFVIILVTSTYIYLPISSPPCKRNLSKQTSFTLSSPPFFARSTMEGIGRGGCVAHFFDQKKLSKFVKVHPKKALPRLGTNQGFKDFDQHFVVFPEMWQTTPWPPIPLYNFYQLRLVEQ